MVEEKARKDAAATETNNKRVRPLSSLETGNERHPRTSDVTERDSRVLMRLLLAVRNGRG